jgi:hypothetical protein
VQTSKPGEAVGHHNDISRHFVMNSEKSYFVTSPHFWFSLTIYPAWKKTPGFDINLKYACYHFFLHKFSSFGTLFDKRCKFDLFHDVAEWNKDFP